MPKPAKSYIKTCKRCGNFYNTPSKFSKICMKCHKPSYWAQRNWKRNKKEDENKNIYKGVKRGKTMININEKEVIRQDDETKISDNKENKSKSY